MKNITILITLLITIWVVEIFNIIAKLITKKRFKIGIVPRSIFGLIMLPIYSINHSNFKHTVANTIPFVVLGFSVALYGQRTFLYLTAFVTIVSGILVWLLGHKAVHMGISNVIFGYFGFIITKAITTKKLESLIIAGVIILLYMSIAKGILPKKGISWEGHLFGLLSGAGFILLGV